MRHIRNSIIAALWIYVTVAGCMPYPVKFAYDLPHFHEVKKGIFRSGFPREKGYERLEEIQIKTVISLCPDGPKTEWEEAQAEKFHIAFFHIPIERGHAGSRKDDIATITGLLKDSNKHPILVHCSDGKNVTGMAIAIYRVLVDHWGIQAAYEEALRYGFDEQPARLKEALLAVKEGIIQ
ncbi:MAG: tyrosine-protein phosphatase [Candidatus Omnitrophica bacterium]|nr:tyrosine-protein phosphatase [Candidatus Omnitrophota bacterium]